MVTLRFSGWMARLGLIVPVLTLAAFHLASLVSSPPAFAQVADAPNAGLFTIYTPVMRSIYTPPALVLAPIENADLDNSFGLSWSLANEAEALPEGSVISVEEAIYPDFAYSTIYPILPDAGEGAARASWTWTLPDPRLPGTYYYRLRVAVGAYVGEWSNPQSVTIHPLFVGLKVRWDGVGYFRGPFSEDIGSHEEWHADVITEGDTVRVIVRSWYNPDPFDLGDGTANLFFSATTGIFQSSNVPPDPEWKWGYPGFLPYTLELRNGQTVAIRGQDFSVRGPLTGHTTYGRSIQYWELVNRKKFLMHDNGDWQQYVREGNAILRYAADGSRLLLYSSVKRHYYQDGEADGATIQYIEQLTSSNALPGGEGLAMQASVPTESAETTQESSNRGAWGQSMTRGPQP